MEAALDSIRIEQLEIFSAVGIEDSERASPQRLTATIEMWMPKPFRDTHDGIAETVDYALVAEITRRIARKNTSLLIETLAVTISSDLLQRFPIAKVEVEIRKFVLQDARYVAVKTSAEK